MTGKRQSLKLEDHAEAMQNLVEERLLQDWREQALAAYCCGRDVK